MRFEAINRFLREPISPMLTTGRAFYKMSGSGNDFVFLDGTRLPVGELLQPAMVRAICARGTGIGADGLVVLERSERADLRMIYLNSDGSRADLCGNASLCSVRLAVDLGIINDGRDSRLETDAGVLVVRYHQHRAEIDLPSVATSQVHLPIRHETNEQWIRFVKAGVPHLSVLVSDVETVDVVQRGRTLRHTPSLPEGANVNFVSADGAGGWHIRTYERGVEGETLACGTGAVATAIQLKESGAPGDVVDLMTRSGRVLRVRLRRVGDAWLPSLSGESRLVFQGSFGEL